MSSQSKRSTGTASSEVGEEELSLSSEARPAAVTGRRKSRNENGEEDHGADQSQGPRSDGGSESDTVRETRATQFLVDDGSDDGSDQDSSLAPAEVQRHSGGSESETSDLSRDGGGGDAGRGKPTSNGGIGRGDRDGQRSDPNGADASQDEALTEEARNLVAEAVAKAGDEHAAPEEDGGGGAEDWLYHRLAPTVCAGTIESSNALLPTRATVSAFLQVCLACGTREAAAEALTGDSRSWPMPRLHRLVRAFDIPLTNDRKAVVADNLAANVFEHRGNPKKVASRARREASLLRAQDPFVAPTLPRTVVNEYHSMRRLVVLRALRPFLLPPDQRILSSFVPGTPAWSILEHVHDVAHMLAEHSGEGHEQGTPAALVTFGVLVEEMVRAVLRPLLDTYRAEANELAERGGGAGFVSEIAPSATPFGLDAVTAAQARTVAAAEAGGSALKGRSGRRGTRRKRTVGERSGSDKGGNDDDDDNAVSHEGNESDRRTGRTSRRRKSDRVAKRAKRR